MTNAPIAVFDSGIGGLTVLRVLKDRFPQESFVYLGDTARLPYGTKSPETVAAYAAQMTTLLVQEGPKPKAIVIACNTASALGMDAVQKVAGEIPVVGMVNPAACSALEVTKNNIIAVLGTQGTIKSGLYERTLKAKNPAVRTYGVACQLLVALAEEGWVDHPATVDIIETYLAPVSGVHEKPDTVILGCTHFPVFLPIFQKLLPQTRFIHCGEAAACALDSIVNQSPATSLPTLRVMVTDGAETFTRMAERFFNSSESPLQVHLTDIPKAA